MEIAKVAGFIMAALLAGCAAEVTRQPAQLVPTVQIAREFVLQETVDILLVSGYTRKLLAGSRWREAGAVPQGNVYRPVNDVLTIEGRHMHEAFLVVDKGMLSGFCLPADRAFAPLAPVRLHLQ